MSRRSEIKAQRKRIIEEYERREYERRKASGKQSTLGLNVFQDMLEELFRLETHPHILKLQKKYPGLYELTWKLTDKYPSRRMTDQEYDNMWIKAINGPSIFDLLPKREHDEWKGGNLILPLELTYGGSNDQ